MSGQLEADLEAMCGVWHDHLQAFDVRGGTVADDPFGGVPGPFPYDNLVYIDYADGVYRQTNVTFAGRARHVRSFEATVADGVLRFAALGPDAPRHIGISGGPGLIWFVAQDWRSEGLARYAEPDLIRLVGDQRWRYTLLYRDGVVVRPMLVEGQRVSTVTSVCHTLDPRGSSAPVHETRAITHHYRSASSADGQPTNMESQ